MRPLHITIVTGLSGAGRSTAVNVLEDLGFYCIDNLPPKLAPDFVAMLAHDPDIKHVGLGIDVRARGFLSGAAAVIDGFVQAGHEVDVIFLDCADDALVRRFSETRRPHPLAKDDDLLSGIQRERERLSDLRALAKRVIDTTSYSVHDLRRVMVDLVARSGLHPKMTTRIVSFGFKFGLPADADLVFDVRFLPNPHFIKELRPQTGMDAPVRDFVLGNQEAQSLLQDVSHLLTRLLPNYEREGKAYLTIAIGCTGGKHRSVAISEALARVLGQEREVVVAHRDVMRL